MRKLPGWYRKILPPLALADVESNVLALMLIWEAARALIAPPFIAVQPRKSVPVTARPAEPATAQRVGWLRR